MSTVECMLFASAVVFLCCFLIERYKRESLQAGITKRESAWNRYADTLESQLYLARTQLASYQDSLFDYTVSKVGEQYTLPVLPKSNGKAVDPVVIVKGKETKLSTLIPKPVETPKADTPKAGDNGNKGTDTPTPAQNATPVSTEAQKAITLADLGTITAREQKLIDKWRANKTPDSESAKRIANIRASEAKHAVKQAA